MKMMSLASVMALAQSTDQIVFAVDALEQELVPNGLKLVPNTKNIATVTTGVVMRSSLAQTRAMTKRMEIVRHTVSP